MDACAQNALRSRQAPNEHLSSYHAAHRVAKKKQSPVCKPKESFLRMCHVFFPAFIHGRYWANSSVARHTAPRKYTKQTPNSFIVPLTSLVGAMSSKNHSSRIGYDQNPAKPIEQKGSTAITESIGIHA